MKFGEGVLSAPEQATTRQLAYMSGAAFGDSIAEIGKMSEAQKGKADRAESQATGPFTL